MKCDAMRCDALGWVRLGQVALRFDDGVALPMVLVAGLARTGVSVRVLCGCSATG
jgi:hypothetical protein